MESYVQGAVGKKPKDVKRDGSSDVRSKDGSIFGVSAGGSNKNLPSHYVSAQSNMNASKAPVQHSFGTPVHRNMSKKSMMLKINELLNENLHVRVHYFQKRSFWKNDINNIKLTVA